MQQRRRLKAEQLRGYKVLPGIITLISIILIFGGLYGAQRYKQDQQTLTAQTTTAQEVEYQIKSGKQMTVLTCKTSNAECGSFTAVLFDFAKNNNKVFYYVDTGSMDETLEVRFFKNGQLVHSFTGAITQEQLAIEYRKAGF